MMIHDFYRGNPGTAGAKTIVMVSKLKNLDVVAQIRGVNQRFARIPVFFFPGWRSSVFFLRDRFGNSGSRFIKTFQVVLDHFLGGSHALNSARLEQDSPITQAQDGAGIMTDKKHGSSFHEAAQEAHAFLGEKSVPDGQGFVNHQDVCINVPGAKDQQLFEAGIRYYK